MRVLRAAHAILFVALAITEARADERSDAAALVEQGKTLYDAGDFAGAAAALERAYVTLAEPRLIYNIARAHERAGHVEEALGYYRRYLAGADQEPVLSERARHALTRLSRSPPPPRATSPTGPSAPSASATPKGPQRDGKPSSHVASTTLLALSGTALAAGVACGIWAGITASEARQSVDPVAKPELRDAAQDRALAADLLFGAAAAAAAGGVAVRLLVEVDRAPRATARGQPRLIGLSLRGTFGP